jgi:hypothetical protein
MTEVIVDAISKKAAGVFQWVVLRLPKLIQSLNDGELDFDKVVEAVTGESNELFSLYDTMLKNDILSLTELRFAMACDDDNCSQDCCELKAEGFIKSDTRMEKLVISLSGGMAVVMYVDQQVASSLFTKVSTIICAHVGCGICLNGSIMALHTLKMFLAPVITG